MKGRREADLEFFEVFKAMLRFLAQKVFNDLVLPVQTSQQVPCHRETEWLLT